VSAARDEFARLQARFPALARWRIEVSARMTSSAGLCYYDDRLIRVAEWLVLRAPEAEVLNTVRHEAAHALAGRYHNHGPVWQAWARELGAAPQRAYPWDLVALAAAHRSAR
jgi:hypothetical protein